MKIKVKGKEKEVEQLAEGVCRSTTASGNHQYYIRCNVTGNYDFRHQQAFDGLLKKHGSIEAIGLNVTSNAGKKHLKGEVATDVAKTEKIVETRVDEAESAEFGKTYWCANGLRGEIIEVEYE